MPVLVAAGFDVTVVDQDKRLTDALAQEGCYELRAGRARETVQVSSALHVEKDAESLSAHLSAAKVITTAVQFERLGAVAQTLATLPIARLTSDGQTKVVLACENAFQASSSLRELVVKAANGERTVAAGWSYADTTVDRICQALWPVSLAVNTEPYWELIVEAIPGAPDLGNIQLVSDVDPYFRRKRYLVNTVADAIAFFGSLMGLSYLHEAARSPRITQLVSPLQDELVRLLELTDGFNERETRRYATRALKRLGRASVRRVLSTVSRNAIRKLGPDERFVYPARRLLEFGIEPTGIAAAIAAILVGSGADMRLLQQLWGDESWATRLSDLVRVQVGIVTAELGRSGPATAGGPATLEKGRE